MRWLAVGVAVISALAAACGGTSAVADSAEPSSDVARIHKKRCGSCHTRVEPGARTREQFEDALSRHHKRVHLRDEQWAAMLDYLSPPPAPPPPAPAAQ